jgi:hypothetical protein
MHYGKKCSGKYCKIFLFQKCHVKGSAENWKILKLLSAAQKWRTDTFSFSDESWSTLSRKINSQNNIYWCCEKPHAVHTIPFT